MIKIVFNNDTEHLIEAESFNYSTTFRIDNYSERNDNANFNMTSNSITNLYAFENVAITSIKIMNSNDEDITTLSFENGVYILNYNGNIYENNVNTYVNLGKVSLSEENNV